MSLRKGPSVHDEEKGKETKGVCPHKNCILSSLISYYQLPLTQAAMTLPQRCGFSLSHKLTSMMPLLLRDGRLTWTEYSFMYVQTYDWHARAVYLWEMATRRVYSPPRLPRSLSKVTSTSGPIPAKCPLGFFDKSRRNLLGSPMEVPCPL
jgi:hypothetical protein